MSSVPGSLGSCSVFQTVACQDLHMWSAWDLDQNTDHRVTGAFTAYILLICRPRKGHSCLPAPVFGASHLSQVHADIAFPSKLALTVPHSVPRSTEKDPISTSETMKTGTWTYHSPLSQLPSSQAAAPSPSHLCSWAACHSMSRPTGKTSVGSPPAPEERGRRRTQMTCRRNLGLLSSLEGGPLGLRRTPLEK